MPRQSFGVPNIRGETVDELRISLQQHLTQLALRVDELAGLRGTPTFYADLDVSGKRLTNLGAPAFDTDAVPASHAITRRATGQWDAQGLPLAGLANAVNRQDGVPYGQLQDAMESMALDAMPVGAIILWRSATPPAGWALCDGTSGTPDLRDRFIVGAGSTYALDATGGATSINLAHTHTADGTLATDSQGAHTHSADGTLATDTNAAANNTNQEVQSGTGVTVAADAHTHSHSHDVTGSTSSNGAHTHDVTGNTSSSLSSPTTTLPPYFALYYIIKL